MNHGVTFILYVKGDKLNGNIPVLFVEGNNLPEAWEKSLIALNEKGCSIRSQYDNLEGPADKDCSITIVINDPLSEPMIHKDIPIGLGDLHGYTLEVIQGIKNQFVRSIKAKVGDTWSEYTSHQRLFTYAIPGFNKVYDQILIMTQKLSKFPHTRQAQAITWKVWEDSEICNPSCLQSIWCRLLKGEDKIWYLNANVRFRSNDAYKVAFMDMFAIVQLLKSIAKNISTITGYQVTLSRYVHQADSYHIYGSDLKEFSDKFLSALRPKTFEDKRSIYEYGNNNG
jgi:thymidylate synthase